MIGAALLGAGGIGTIHARNLAASEDFTLRHIVDLDEGRARRLAEAHGGQAGGDLAVALGDDAVEAVIVGSSTSAHEAHVLAAAEAGKAILCEKPIADSLEAARACIEAVARAGVVAATGFNRRLDAAHAALYDAVRGGEIGRVETLRLVSRSETTPAPESVATSGGMLREKGAHFYDLAAWIAGAEPVEVSGMADCLIDPGFADHGDVDTALLVVRFDSGALASFDFSRRAAYGYDEAIEVHGSGGLLESPRQRRDGPTLWKGEGAGTPGLDPSWYNRFEATYQRELAVFARAIRDGTPVHASMADGLRAQAVAEAARVVVAENRAIGIARIW